MTDTMKFSKDDRFVIGTLTGSVTRHVEGTVYRQSVYDVQFDGNRLGGTDPGADTLRTSRVNAEWFDEVAELWAPENARQIIDGLPDRATFTLTSDGAEPRYFRKGGGQVWEYSDPYLEEPYSTPWNLHQGSGLFTTWTPEEYADYTVPEKPVPTPAEQFEALELGDKFRYEASRLSEAVVYVKTAVNGYSPLTPWKLNDRYFEWGGLARYHSPDSLIGPIVKVD